MNLKRCFYLLAIWLAPALPCLAADPVYLQELIHEAHEKNLASAPEWRALLHYHSNLLFPGVTGQADDDAFYNARDGKTNPAAELDATLTAFFSDAIETDTKQNPQCAFIARYHWLKEELNFDPRRLPEQTCARFNAWRAALNPRSLTLVFPAAYINNPSSMFGHTFLRVDGADQDENTRLLAYAINYAVNPHGEGGTTFIVKSLIGSYPGLFSIAPYYIKVKEYSDLENRDIWEYQLNFTPDEIERLLEHAWELGPIKFDYYFFDENCAYHLLSLFEVARPSLQLTDQFHGWVIPADTIRIMAEQSGMVQQVVFRPANSTRLRYRLKQMNPHDQKIVRALAEQEMNLDDPRVASLPMPERAAVLEAAYEYLRYEYNTGHARAGSDRRSRDLLLARSQLPLSSPGPAVPVPLIHPDEGHKTLRLALSIGSKDGRGFEEFKLRPAYHDLLDADGGYTPGAQINFMDFALRHYAHSDDVIVERFTPIDIVSLSPRDTFFKPISWKINTGLAREQRAKDDDIKVFRTNGGAGLATAPWSGALLYGFLEATLDVGRSLNQDYALGIGPSAGLLAQVTDRWKANLFGRVLDYELGDNHVEQELGLEQSFAITSQSAIRLGLTRQRERDYKWNTAMLSLHLYF